MKKIIFLIILFLLPAIFFAGKSTVLAQTTGTSNSSSSIRYPEPYPDGNVNFLGQDHNYSVVFRGNGEAVVSLKVTFTNKEKKSLSQISLRVPKVEPRELTVFQIVKEPICIRYSTAYPNLSKYVNQSGTCTQYLSSSSCGQAENSDNESCYWYWCVNKCLISGFPTTQLCEAENECVEYQQQTSYDYYQYYSNAKYQKVDAQYSGDTIKFTLPYPVQPNYTGAFFVYFRAFGYAKKNILGGYKFKFETLKVEDEIRNLRVGVSTDSDLVLRGAKGVVNYRFEESGVQAIAGAPSSKMITNPAVDSFVSQIGQGTLTKTASNLSPLESYTVNGQYAGSRLALYSKEILIVVAIVLGVLGLIYLIIKKVVNKLGQRKDVVSDEKKEATNQIGDKTKQIFLTLGLSFATSFIIGLYTAAIIFLGESLNNIVDYRFQVFVVLFLIIISFCIYSVLLFGPAVYIGYKKGVGWGIATVVITIFWLFLFLFFGVMILILLSNRYIPVIEPFVQSIK